MRAPKRSFRVGAIACAYAPGIVVAAALGCGGSPREDALEIPTTEGGGSTSAGTTDESDDAMTKLDISSAPDLGVGDLNCEAVDFLFVIDNSSSMKREQERLVEAVPGFTASILSALPGISDVRVGVVDTDAYPGLGTTDPLDGCPDGMDCSGCDYQLGALLTKPASALDPAIGCGFSTGAPWMDSRSDTFADEFACAANVGIEGNQIERQAGALVSAISPALLDGGCNDGFLRDNALLIVLVITDEEDDHEHPPPPQGGSIGEPADWYTAILQAKHGRATNVVALGLFGGDPLYGDCDPLEASGTGAERAPRLAQLFASFEIGFVGSVCQAGYAGFFDDALQSVARGCAQFVPG